MTFVRCALGETREGVEDLLDTWVLDDAKGVHFTWLSVCVCNFFLKGYETRV